MKNRIELKLETDVFQSALIDGIFVASIWNKTIELGGIEIAKEASSVKTNIDTEKLVQVMSTEMQALLFIINGD